MPDRSPNAEQIDFWNGPSGETWAREQERLDRTFRPLTAALVARIGASAGERILDIGCGCGELALLLARQVEDAGEIVGIDISEPMLAIARSREAELRQRKPEGGRLTWRRADASSERLDPRFDALVSRFGVMFFDDPPAAFRNLRGALKPGGRLVVMCWQEPSRNGWASVAMRAVTERFGGPQPSPPHAPGPFAFADSERVLGILRSGGFAEVAAEPVEATMRIGFAHDGVPALEDAVDYAMTIGPLARLLRERAIARDEAAPVVRASLEPFAAGDAVELPAACWMFTGRA